ncbi:MAG: hypothetical protein ACJ70U_03230 [Nitrososphaera sp.]
MFTNKIFSIIAVVATLGITAVITTVPVYANNAADPPQQPTAHFEDPANPNALEHAKDKASDNSLPLYCGTLSAEDPVPEGCINDVPEDFPPSLLPPN